MCNNKLVSSEYSFDVAMKTWILKGIEKHGYCQWPDRK